MAEVTQPRILTVAFLDVGQGDATIVLPPEGEGAAVVFDCRDGWVVRQQLSAWRVTELAAVVASHLDLDHIGGLGDLLAAKDLRIQEVYWSADRDLSDGSPGANKAKALHGVVTDGDKDSRWGMRSVERHLSPLLSGRDWAIHLAAPRGGKRAAVSRTGSWEDANIYSAVLRVNMAGVSVMIGGDAPLITWSELPEQDLTAQVFRVPHHGGSLHEGGVPEGWSTGRLYDRIAPSTSVISVGTRNDYGHPEPNTGIAPLIGRPAHRLLCTQVTRRCHATFQDSGSIQAFREAELRDWVDDARNGMSHFAEPPWRHLNPGDPRTLEATRVEVPCTGTITVRIDESGGVAVDPMPENLSLASRISRWETPLCCR